MKQLVLADNAQLIKNMEKIIQNLSELVKQKNDILNESEPLIFVICLSRTDFDRYLGYLRKAGQDTSVYRYVESGRSIAALHPPLIHSFVTYDEAYLHPFWDSDIHKAKLRELKKYALGS